MIYISIYISIYKQTIKMEDSEIIRLIGAIKSGEFLVEGE